MVQRASILLVVYLPAACAVAAFPKSFLYINCGIPKEVPTLSTLSLRRLLQLPLFRGILEPWELVASALSLAKVTATQYHPLVARRCVPGIAWDGYSGAVDCPTERCRNKVGSAMLAG